MEPHEAARLRGAIRHAELCEQRARRDQSTVIDHEDAVQARRRVTEATAESLEAGIWTVDEIAVIEATT